MNGKPGKLCNTICHIKLIFKISSINITNWMLLTPNVCVHLRVLGIEGLRILLSTLYRPYHIWPIDLFAVWLPGVVPLITQIMLAYIQAILWMLPTRIRKLNQFWSTKQNRYVSFCTFLSSWNLLSSRILANCRIDLGSVGFCTLILTLALVLCPGPFAPCLQCSICNS